MSNEFFPNLPYRPEILSDFGTPPAGFPYGVEVYVPGKEVQVKGFHSYEEAQTYRNEVLKLLKSVALYVRICRENRYFSVHPGTKMKILAVPMVKGKLYCHTCGDYTVFHKKFGWEGTDEKHCQFCGNSTGDFYVKSYNGLWGPTKRTG